MVAPIDSASWLPFLFGFWGALAGALTGLGSLFGNAAGGRAEGRAKESELALGRDRNNISSYGINQQAVMEAIKEAIAQQNEANNLDLKRRQFSLDATGQRAGQAVRGDVMRNAQDVKFKGLPARIRVPEITGGLRPSNMGPGSRAFGDTMTRQALAAQLSGDTFKDTPPIDASAGVLKPPSPTDLPKPSGLDKFLNIAGLVSGGLGALGQGSDAIDWDEIFGRKPKGGNAPGVKVTPVPYDENAPVVGSTYKSWGQV